MAKFGSGNGDWGTYAGADYDDQLWKLTPRFKSSGDVDVVWSFDNRAGSQDLTKEITITTGFSSLYQLL